MIDQQALTRMESELNELLAEKFGLSSGPLTARLQRLGRRVPGYVRRAAQVLVEAGAHVGHPKLMMQVDAAEVERAYRTLRQHLKTVDVKDRRKGAVLSLLGSLSFNLLAVLALLLLILVWRGFL
ncbi:hypothetical protein TL5118_02170 [Thalassovita autumnalis]|uniref:Uncharacterized protein n=1 Tax=Thalassovita autumnalis TaxID=2072972 RepID=A0A0P1FHK1_9RHOB|nr:hypothetical protein [Thalassovita autumnalis]CUH67387.1 hypothetical protein TL5118_02170 [Thalassovita autumnalis]CUH73868.1 hypothetical protein TL5120_03685 [Thalassovita autumnalis]